jgi:hypothetical protein
MTEAEAKTKWCPFTRVGHDTDTGDTPFNRLHGEVDGVEAFWMPAATLCIGSACMAWRELSPARGEMWLLGRLDPAKPATGFCGLGPSPL